MVSKPTRPTSGDQWARAAGLEDPSIDRGREDPRRKRLLDGVAELVYECGYQAISTSDIVKRVGVSRKTFYDYFEGKEEAFIAVVDTMTTRVVERVEHAFVEADSWPKGVEAAIEALLDDLAADPSYAKCCLIESLSATPHTARHYEAFLQEVCDLFKPDSQDLPPGVVQRLPDTVTETIVGGIFWLLFQSIQQNRDLRELLPELVEFALAPYRQTEKELRVTEEDSRPLTRGISMEQLLQNALAIRGRRPSGVTGPDAAEVVREDRDR